ncbi:ribonuclease H-like domain-containing protein [Rhizophagus irregularis DAOM 181602=DAOM 197198]|nr:ribonuclease H-like domain-containing protein [Rhizophagus irregularis DAOM 181602=DAOM 197198]
MDTVITIEELTKHVEAITGFLKMREAVISDLEGCRDRLVEFHFKDDKNVSIGSNILIAAGTTGEYAAARRQLRVEYPKAALKTLITKCSPERIGTPSTSRAGVSRQLSKFNSSAKNISYTHFGQWLIYYYQAWFNETPKRILRDYLSYQRELFPFNSETYNQFEENIIDFWESAKGLAPELSKLALHLFGICVNAASVERLWSNMGFLHSTRRNKLHHKKVLAMAQLRSDILCKRKRDDIEISERQYKRLHIAELIQEYQSDEEDTNDNEFTFNAFNDSDTEELEETSVIDECNVNDTFEKTNNSDNINSEQWTKIIEDWIKMVNAEININNTEVIGEETYEFEIGGQSIHPADNPLAKWKLLDLFNETLEAPVNMF